MNIFPKLKLSPRIIKFAYRFLDVEASAETAPPDGRIIEYSFIIQKLAQAPRGKVLDVGCTARLNYLPAALASLGWQVWGIDLREFKFKHPNFRFISGSIWNTNFPDNFFDAVYAVSTIEHLGLSGRYGITKEDAEGDVRAVREIARILRPDGIFLCTVPYGKEARIIKPLQRVYDKSSLERLFRNWTWKDEVYYSQDDKGYWVSMPEENVIKVEDPSGNSTIALLELSPLNKVETSDGVERGGQGRRD